ncbi:MAG: hypothetical protein WCJ09_07575 [Planctomycetota bacterium]
MSLPEDVARRAENDVLFLCGVASRQADQVVRQDHLQPAPQFGIRLPAITVEIAMSFQHRLLHDVGRVFLDAQPWVQMQIRQQLQAAAELFEIGDCVAVVGRFHVLFAFPR